MDKDFEAVILSAVDLGAIVVREALARAGVEPSEVGDVVPGCVLQAGNGMNVARQAALRAGPPVETPGETVNRVCGGERSRSAIRSAPAVHAC